MKNIIKFSIIKEPEGYYVATGIGHPIVTDGDTLDQLQENIKEAVSLYLEGENLADLGLSSYPSLFMNVQIARNSYA